MNMFVISNRRKSVASSMRNPARLSQRQNAAPLRRKIAPLLMIENAPQVTYVQVQNTGITEGFIIGPDFFMLKI